MKKEGKYQGGYKHDIKMANEMTANTRKCSCGASIIILPTMKQEYRICTWCGKKVFKDIEKQKIQDEKIKNEEFRMNMWRLLNEKKSTRKTKKI